MANEIEALKAEIRNLRGAVIFPRNEDRLDDFERQRAEIDRLRTALKRIRDEGIDHPVAWSIGIATLANPGE